MILDGDGCLLKNIPKGVTVHFVNFKGLPLCNVEASIDLKGHVLFDIS